MGYFFDDYDDFDDFDYFQKNDYMDEGPPDEDLNSLDEKDPDDADDEKITLYEVMFLAVSPDEEKGRKRKRQVGRMIKKNKPELF